LLSFAKDSNPLQSAVDGLREIISNHNLYNRYRNSGDSVYSDPIENINNVVKIASLKQRNMAEFLDHVRKITYARKSKKEKDLTLATVHQAKGREWVNVFIIGAEHGVIPHKDGETPEERRIFFVACSRAAKRLQISWSGNKSMFLEEYEHEEYETNSEESAEISTSI
jgi:superfamily I DNA/RNA helicase